MLTPDEINALQYAVGIVTDSVNAYLINDVCERIAAAGKITATAEYEIYRAQTLGVHFATIQKEIKKRLKISAAQIDDLFNEAAKISYGNEVKAFGRDYLSFEENGAIQQIVKAAQTLAQDDFSNVTQTLGMLDRHGRDLPLRRFYNNVMDDVFNRVSTGATDYNTAIRDACAALADRGVTSIGYESGVVTSLEVAARRNVLSGLGLMIEQISQSNHAKIGANGWEISAHANSAPDHEEIQGRQLNDEGFRKMQSGQEFLDANGKKYDSFKRRIGTLNCGHVASPVILGVNQPQYTNEDLQKFKDDNKKGVIYEGKHYTGYQATQEMRRLERVARKWKRREIAAKGSGDNEMLIRAKTRQANTRRAIKEFGDASGLRIQHDRMFVTGYKGAGSTSIERRVSSMMSLSGMNTSTGQVVTSVPAHFSERAIQRDISAASVRNALQSPLKIGKIRTDRSQQFIGKDATVAINVDTGKLATVWQTGKNARKKWGDKK